jgi:hypothetical protein
MIFRRPPALANWLLDRFGTTRQNAALAGDLLEEFRNGRSAAWYWRQSLRAIATGIAHDGIARRPYLLALGAAYAVQLAITLMLWWKHAPPPIHATGWIKFGVWLLAQLIFPVSTGLVNRFVVGDSTPDMKRMYCTAESGTPRFTVLGLAAFQSFYLGLSFYGLCALIFPRFSLTGLIGLEMTWFVLWILTPALAPLSAPSTAVETEKEDPSSLAIPDSEPNLPVVLSGDRTVILEPHSLAQSVFAAADQELIAVVFARGRSLELLRRAVWLGVCRSRSIRERTEAFSLAELAALIDETATGSCDKPSQPEGFRQRLRLGFRGDPA